MFMVCFDILRSVLWVSRVFAFPIDVQFYDLAHGYGFFMTLVFTSGYKRSADHYERPDLRKFRYHLTSLGIGGFVMRNLLDSLSRCILNSA